MEIEREGERERFRFSWVWLDCTPTIPIHDDRFEVNVKLSFVPREEDA